MNSVKEIALNILILTGRDLFYEGKKPYCVRAKKNAQIWIQDTSNVLFSLNSVCEILSIPNSDVIRKDPAILLKLDKQERGGRMSEDKKRIKKKKIEKEPKVPKKSFGKFHTNVNSVLKKLEKEEERKEDSSGKKYEIIDGGSDAIIYYNISYWYGSKVSDMSKDYEGRGVLRWMLSPERNFPEELCEIIQNQLEKKDRYKFMEK